MLVFVGLAVPAGFGLWWTLWPMQTAHEFVELVARHQFEEAKKMLKSPLPESFDVRHLRWDDSNHPPDISLLPRDLSSLLSGRQQFVVGNTPATFTTRFGKTAVQFQRTRSLTANQSITLRISDYAKRIRFDNNVGLKVKVNPNDPAEITLSANQSPGAAGM